MYNILCVRILFYSFNFLTIKLTCYNLPVLDTQPYCFYSLLPYMVLFTFFNLFTCMTCVHFMLSHYYITPFFFNKLKQNSNWYIQYFAVYQSYTDCPNRYGLLRTLLDLRNTTGGGSRFTTSSLPSRFSAFWPVLSGLTSS